MGILQFESKKMTTEEAEEFLKQTTYFDYLKGRVMKVSLSSDTEFEEWLYDRDNGQGSAERIRRKVNENEKKIYMQSNM